MMKYLDSQWGVLIYDGCFWKKSIVNVLYNPKLLCNIHQVDGKIHVWWNQRISKTNIMGALPIFGDVWFYLDGIVRII